MEILAEIAVWLLEFFAETLLQILVEAIAGLFEAKSVTVRDARRERLHLPSVTQARADAQPSFSQALGKTLLYVLVGGLFGWLSIFVFPNNFIRSPHLQLVNIAITPLIAAGVMVWLGTLRHKHDKPAIGLDKFVYAYSLALSMAVVRHSFAV